MTLLNKILLIALVIVLVGSFSFIAYKENQWSKQQTETLNSMTEMKQIAGGLVRSQATYATQDDLNNFAKQNKLDLAVIQDDLSKLNANVSGINVAIAVSNAQQASNLPSTHTTPNSNPKNPPTVDCNGKQLPCPDPFGFAKNRQELQLNEQFAQTQIPFGKVGFSSWQQNPWDTQINSRQYNMTNVLGTDENGKQYVYNKFVINADGKDYTIPITSAKFEQEFPAKKFRFNPQLFMGLDGGIAVSTLPVQGAFGPNIGFGFFGYGKTKDRNDFSVLQVGAGWDAATSRPQAVITPFAYNLGTNIPFIKNTYIAPLSVAVETNGNVFLQTGLRIGF